MKRIAALFLILVLVKSGTFPAGAQDGKQPPITSKNAEQVRQIGLLAGGDTEYVGSIAFSPDGSLLAFGRDSTVQLWDMARGQSKAILTGTRRYVTRVAFSPDGSLLAYGSFDPAGNTDDKVLLWDVTSGQPKAPSPGAMEGIAFSPNGKILAIAYGEVRLWDTRTGKLNATLPNRDNYVWINSVVFSPDGSLLAGASRRNTIDAGNTIQLWDVRSGKLIANLYNRNDFVDGDTVAFSPDGKLLASGTDDSYYGFTVRLWDTKTYKLKATLQPKGETGIKSVAFSPNGSLLAEGGQQGVVRLWDVKSGQLMVTLKGHSDFVVSVAFSPDGTLLASGSQDGTLRLWGVPADQVFDTHN